MRSEVKVCFAHGQEFETTLTEADKMAPDVARRWLDEQFVANDCEPLRASGKVLIADKILVVAATVGPHRFADDAEFRHGFARAAAAALGRPVVRIDVEMREIGY